MRKKAKPKTKPSRKKYTGGHRLALTRRIVQIPLLIKQESQTQSDLAKALGVDRKTINRDLTVLQEFYPIKQIKQGRFRVYRWEE